MTDADWRDIVEVVKPYEQAKFVVTHGTDTMFETASFFASAFAWAFGRANRRHEAGAIQSR
jgi:L-asparaginase/Glu-tRNA(Gln) amidotransferase subunit D